MVEETKTQASASRAKGGRKGKMAQFLTNKATATSCQLALIAQLDNVRMFNSNAQKLIQEIRSIQMESSLLGKPFANDTLFLNLQKCTICHPMYKETVTTISQLNFNALTAALIICQSAIKSNPAQKIDPCQDSARIASSDNQNKSAKMDKKDKKDNGCTSVRVAARPRKIQCWVCKQSGHRARQCDASVTIPKNSPLAKAD
ncbi:hypothetical protein NDA11_001049 [Ustilago hordei]|uniref:CCHC-type domain-containing protein n=1 Tax=Ustilago hordei TaxID=120017 RepID=I2FSV9_USTHO|nr:hypothetical protein NDA10_000793 [Ustilago hordei]KAJ1570558.1 hypothetical protein NDA11_001049 [Ustilago hordei]KAJ1587163.1 hypothetical protein NDA15_002651 [Ustilago hordei]KAJ1590351.1 hypothetical protein NDA12_006455 [Ustilago hordei]UTT96589.1 hypothetical protein NDA17_005842 [Ustilago hordei]